MSWLAHALGLYEGVGYHLWSGIMPCVLASGFLWGWFTKHRCRAPHCWSWALHEDPDGLPKCHRHRHVAGDEPMHEAIETIRESAD